MTTGPRHSTYKTTTKEVPMNRNMMFLVFAAVLILGLIGAGLLLFFRPDASATFIGLLVTLLTTLTTTSVLFYGLSKQGTAIETIKTNTNGTLSALHEENLRLTNILIASGADPTIEPVPAVVIPTAAL